MYSSHRIDRVTCLRFSSRWMEAQSGSAFRADLAPRQGQLNLSGALGSARLES